MPEKQPRGFLDHQQLMIVKGIGKTATDNLSAENDPVIVNLISAPINLETNGWSPNIPAVKSGGVWADSPITDGRTLLAAPEGNVTETMNLIISDASYLTAMKALSGLNQMVLDCRQYWQSQYQIDPVYLLWWAGCGIGPQYALISNIEIKPEYQDSPSPTIRASMTIEREPFWRGLAPGANPKLWTFYVNNQQIGLAGKVLADATLVTGSDHLITQTINNKFEWNPTAAGLQTTPITQNYIDITAAQVPGDAPALVEFCISSANNNAFSNLYIGKTSKPLSGTGHDNVRRVNALNLNCGDAAVGSSLTKTAGVSGTGVKSNNSSVTFYFGTRTSTGAGTWVNASVWDSNPGANGILLDRQLLRGSYAIFARAFNASGAAVSTDMKMRIYINESDDTTILNSLTLPEVYPPLSLGLSYMGTVTLPFASRSVQSLLGYGVQLQEGKGNLTITLQYEVLVATANRIFTAVDVILVPLDEAMTQLVLINDVTSFLPSTGAAVIDNTGYLSRGGNTQLATMYQSGIVSGGASFELRGANLTLSPKTNQRLYFLNDGLLDMTETIRLNIIPRWAGIRDS